MSLFWDLDNTLRDFSEYNDFSMDEIIESNPHIIGSASSTKYTPLIRKLNSRKIFVRDKYDRKENERWINSHIGVCTLIYYKEAHEKVDYLGNKDMLVDTSVIFDDYNDIILIRTDKNKNIGTHRVKSPYDLEILIEYLVKMNRLEL